MAGRIAEEDGGEASGFRLQASGGGIVSQALDISVGAPLLISPDA